MIFVRLETRGKNGISSKPFVFCSRCRKPIDGRWNFCAWCSHQLSETKTPQTVYANERDYTYDNVYEFLRSRIDWNKGR